MANPVADDTPGHALAQPLRAYTVATGKAGYFDALVASCERHGLSLEVLGQGQEWKGFLWRLKLVDEALSQLPPDELALVTDGYDTMVMSEASELREAYGARCKDAVARDPADLEPLVLAPEHPREWCTWLFSQLIVRSSFRLYGLSFAWAQPASPAYVLNAGVILGTARSLRAYYAAVFEEADATGSEDDQWLLNRLYWSNRLPVPVGVDMQGSVAHCHANRDLARSVFSMFVDQNRHRIPHRQQLVLEEGGGIRVRRSGARVGILHAITNADVDALCAHASLPRPQERKVMNQVGVRFLLNLTRVLIYLLLAVTLWAFAFPGLDARLAVPSLTLAGVCLHSGAASLSLHAARGRCCRRRSADGRPAEEPLCEAAAGT